MRATPLASLALIILVVLSAGAALTPVADSDIWWHMAAGREMLARRGFLWADPFSLGARGRPWIDLHWLFQLGAYGLYQLGGLGALVAGKALLVGGGAFIMMRAVEAGLPAPADAAAGARTRRMARALLALALPLGLLWVRHLLLARPVLVTLVFCAAFLLILEHLAAGGRPRVAWALLPITVVWANCQGLWPLGPLLIGCVLLGDGAARLRGRRELPAGRARPLLGLLVLCGVAGFITPYGWRGLALPIKLLLRLVPASANVFSQQVAENVPPWTLARGAPLQLLPLLLLLLLLAASFLVARPDRRLGRGLIALAFTALALSANRNLLLLVWMGVPLAVANAAPAVATALARWSSARRPARLLAPALWGAGCAGVTALLLLALSRETALDQPAPFRVPAASARLIGESPSNGRIFAADHYGGYFIWALHPRAAPYLDTRLVLRTADEYAEFLALLDDPPRWQAFDARHHFDHVSLPTDFPDRYLPLIAHLYRSAGFSLVYTDGSETLFRRDADGLAALDLGARATTARILADQAARYPAGEVADAARRQLARLQLALGHVEEALHVLAPLTAVDPAAQALAARGHLQLGDISAAEAIARRLLEDGRAPVVASNLLALASIWRRDLPGAVTWLRKSLAADPYDPEARAILEQLEAQAADPGAAAPVSPAAPAPPGPSPPR